MRLTPLALTATLAAVALPAQVKNGLDVLVDTDFAALKGRKIGLITNHTGIDRHRRQNVDLMLAADGFELVALFSPEHGFSGTLDQARIADATHGSGLPIHSLYGETRKPTAEMLEGLDTLVFDIQDIGCRFYTYISTMGLAMQAAAEHGKRFVVLDRVNPIGGVAVEGPILDPGSESFVGFHTIPVRHGMTVGEIARMLNAEQEIGCELEIVELDGWERSMWFDATGQPWIDPSPNMRTLTQALLYPGVGLVETTNLSVGRGTDTPFEHVGAPWIDGPALAARLNGERLPGIRCYPVRFTPTSSKFADESCEGVHFVVTDRDAFESLRFGMALASALRALHPDDWELDRYRRLLADDAVLDAIRAGESTAELTAVWADELAAFGPRRAEFLVYR